MPRGGNYKREGGGIYKGGTYAQLASYKSVRNNFLSVISINEVDNEFQSMIVLGK